MFEELFTTANLIAFLTLTALEIVLGVDNVVFLAILVDRLPRAQQALARRLGLLGAAVMRILLLLVIDWIADLTEPFYQLDILGWQHPISWRDVILILGGLVLIAKATIEIGHMVGDAAEHDEPGLARKAVSSFSSSRPSSDCSCRSCRSRMMSLSVVVGTTLCPSSSRVAP